MTTIAAALIVVGAGTVAGTVAHMRRRVIDLRSTVAGHTAPVHTRLRVRG